MERNQVIRKVRVQGDTLKFSSAHFLTFGGKCESLHGHNYGVSVEIEGTLNEDTLIFDFTILKQITREICQQLNHRFLLPVDNPHLALKKLPDAWEVHFGEKYYIFPKTDVVELPIDNSTAERLAEYITRELRSRLAKYNTTNLHTITVGVEEAPTQRAYHCEVL